MPVIPSVLSIDLGTGGPKVAWVGLDGRVVSAATRPVRTLRIAPDGAEQDPEEIWIAVRSAVQEVVKEAGRSPGEIVGVSVASQFSSIVPVDRAGRPVGNLVLWMDGRGGAEARRIHSEKPESVARWLEVHGVIPLPSGADSLSHMLWIQHGRPDVYARTHKLLEPMDYLTARLTGRCTANACTVFMMLLTDNRELDAVGYDDALVAASGLDPGKLPELVPVSSVVGPVLPEVATELGLAPGTPVFSGTNDTQAVAVGTGTFREGQGALNVGTTSQVLAHVRTKKTDIENDIVSAPSPVAGLYTAIAENGLGGKALDHFLRRIAFASDALGDHATEEVFAGLEGIVRSAPPGSGGLLVFPWLTGTGAPGSDPHVRGAFLNLSLETDRACMVRAILEGVAFSLRWLLAPVERFAERRFDALGFSGGAAGSAEWAQIMADVTGRPVLQHEDARHVINRATALLAFEALGLAGLDQIERFCPVRRSFEPRAEPREIYDRLFERFLLALDRNRPLFEALNG